MTEPDQNAANAPQNTSGLNSSGHIATEMNQTVEKPETELRIQNSRSKFIHRLHANFKRARGSASESISFDKRRYRARSKYKQQRYQSRRG